MDLRNELGESAEQQSSAARARAARPADEDDWALDSLRHLQFQAGFLQEHGLRRTSTVKKFRPDSSHCVK